MRDALMIVSAVVAITQKGRPGLTGVALAARGV